MVPTLPGSLPSWITPRRLVAMAQLISLSFLVYLVAQGLAISLGAGLLLWIISGVTFALLALSSGGQSSWIAVAASYGEIGAWSGSLFSALFFAYFFVSHSRPHEVTPFICALICTALLGWLPGLLAGLVVGFLFWATGGWLLSSLQQHKVFPAHDDSHQLLFRVGGWFIFLSLFGLWLDLSPLILAASVAHALVLLFFLVGVSLISFAFLSLKKRSHWLQEILAGRVAKWGFIPKIGHHPTLLPLSNREHQDLILVYRLSKPAPYRSNEEEVEVAIY
jgi:hypothetical protein